VIASLFFSPHLHYHDLAVLSIPILCVLIIFIEAKIIQSNKAGLCILLISTILLISEIFDPLRFVIPYTLLAFLFVAAWKTRNYSFDQNPPQNM
jgi:membrane-bound ClpP family serine protease